ncbi:MAG: hypothetical protein R6W67_01415 [Bacteroidales bacterium]
MLLDIITKGMGCEVWGMGKRRMAKGMGLWERVVGWRVQQVTICLGISK